MNSFPHTFHRLAVIGAGAWGTSLAYHLGQHGHPIQLWAHESETVQTIQHTRKNSLFLPNITLPDTISPTSTFSEALKDCEAVVLAVPSHAMRPTIQGMQSYFKRPLPLIIATKGIEDGSLKLMSQVLMEELSPEWEEQLFILTGPSFAAEVCAGKPTTILLSVKNLELATSLQALFMTPLFRVYTAQDLIGAQLGGSLKNVMAIASGVVDGLNLGFNARAALITRGLAEMIRLGKAMGAHIHTFYGLSGLGDLVLTCTGSLSRNYSVGLNLGRGQSLRDILAETKTVAEGVNTAKAAFGLSTHYHVDMPIVQAVNEILFQEKPPLQAVSELMARASKVESEFPTIAS
jgi:glycerol-3-phosphate dehydrogenase (NAD(P)+)